MEQVADMDNVVFNMDNAARSIILVDDDADDRQLFTEAIQQTGTSFQLELITDGSTLLKRLAARDQPLPNLVFLDLNIPALSGKDCLKKIRSVDRYNKVKVIIFSTSNAPTDIAETFEKGADLYVSKPRSFGGLVNTIRDVIDLDWNTCKAKDNKSNFVFATA